MDGQLVDQKTSDNSEEAALGLLQLSVWV